MLKASPVNPEQSSNRFKMIIALLKCHGSRSKTREHKRVPIQATSFKTLIYLPELLDNFLENSLMSGFLCDHPSNQFEQETGVAFSQRAILHI
ncbi:hypothetical protein PanWU01x14_200920 [Parasponia andersonii]|uniref:Uncharacterized protein n=1 Tax=Parasponia andersonii TaxID=3476 RepID=A0A2P5BXX2_PARAD|nr:hypothetical protein PanWU01x14_200920 [Parasponia andersonii]